MSYLKAKSEFNLEAAKKLCDEELYASSIHCSYYSIFQLMKYIVNVFCGITYVDQDKEITNLRGKQHSKGIGSHQYIINKIQGELENYDKKESIITIRKIKDLRNSREVSDYKNIEIGSLKGHSAYEKSNELNNKLKMIFNLC